jgi:hypothetical protein
MSGFVGGFAASVTRSATLGAVVGRLDVRDLVRTTTTPSAIGGSIPVYTQYAGASGQVALGHSRLAALVRFHDERFDYIGETGFTLDLGIRVEPAERLVIAAATHFFPIDFSNQSTTDLFVGLEYGLLPRTRIGALSTSVVGRYGATLRSREDLEHILSLGLLLGSTMQLDAAVARELGPETHALRPSLGITLRLGRYLIGLARSDGLNDLGATYRIGLDAAIRE